MAIQRRVRALQQKSKKKPKKVVYSDKLGDTQATVLAAVMALSPMATINAVLLWMMEETSDIPDVAQTYVAMKSFVTNELVRPNGMVPSEDGGREMKAFAITSKGMEALEKKVTHNNNINNLIKRGRAEADKAQKTFGLAI